MVQRRRNHSVYWGAIVLDTFKYLLDTNIRFNGNDIRVFLFLCYHINYENNICYLSQKNIAENLQIHKSSVSKAIKKLIQKQFIVKASNPKGFMVNPNLFYVSKPQKNDRESIRDEFNILLGEIEPIFKVDEDFHNLEVNNFYR